MTPLIPHSPHPVRKNRSASDGNVRPCPSLHVTHCSPKANLAEAITSEEELGDDVFSNDTLKRKPHNSHSLQIPLVPRPSSRLEKPHSSSDGNVCCLPSLQVSSGPLNPENVVDSWGNAQREMKGAINNDAYDGKQHYQARRSSHQSVTVERTPRQLPCLPPSNRHLISGPDPHAGNMTNIVNSTQGDVCVPIGTNAQGEVPRKQSLLSSRGKLQLKPLYISPESSDIKSPCVDGNMPPQSK